MRRIQLWASVIATGSGPVAGNWLANQVGFWGGFVFMALLVVGGGLGIVLSPQVVGFLAPRVRRREWRSGMYAVGAVLGLAVGIGMAHLAVRHSEKSQPPSVSAVVTPPPSAPPAAPSIAAIPPQPSQQTQGPGSHAYMTTGPNSPIIVNPEKQSPRFGEFQEKVESVSVQLGGGDGAPGGAMVEQSADFLRKKPYSIAIFGDYQPVWISMKGNQVNFRFTTWNGSRQPNVEVENGTFVVRPSGWDVNNSATELEVVDEKGRPVVQIIRKRPSVFIVNAVLDTPTGPIAAGPEGFFAGASIPKNYKLNPIFKYPSRRFPGQYADPPKS